jgi:hypothetical protein
MHANAKLEGSGIDQLRGILICDGITVKASLIFNPQDGSLVGVAGAPLSLEGIFEELFLGEGKEEERELVRQQLTSKINQYVWRSVEQPFLVFVLEHFSNAGNLDGNEQTVQMMHVMHRAQCVRLVTVHCQTNVGASNIGCNNQLRSANGSDKYPTTESLAR